MVHKTIQVDKNLDRQSALVLQSNRCLLGIETDELTEISGMQDPGAGSILISG